MEEQKTEKCINQIFKSTSNIDRRFFINHGDCRVCITDKDNKNCSGYVPLGIEIKKYEVK
jgi:hypothetical protein